MKGTMVQALNQAMMQEMERNESILLIGEDIGINGGVFRVSEGLFEKFGSQRVIDTPLSESAIVGTAIGMAAYGLRPIAEIQFMGFILPAFNQIVAHAARIRNRTRGRYQVPLVVRMPYGGGVKAPEHHSESTEALFCHIPGLKVVVPSTPFDAKGLLISSIRDDDPVLFLEPKKLYRAGQQEFPDEPFEIPLGEAKVVREGDDLTIITWGAMVPVVKQAAEMAEEEEIFAEVLDLMTLSPMDHKSIIHSVKSTGRAMIVHEAPKTCGLGAEIAARISEDALFHLEAPVIRITGYDITVPLPKGEDLYYPTPDRVLEAMIKITEY